MRKLALLASLALLFGLLYVLWPSLSGSRHQMPASGDFLRIVSLAPSYTEVIKSLGLSDRLVGVTSHCEIKDKTIVGSFQDANFEAIMALKPDLIVAVPHLMAQGVLKLLLEHGITVFARQPDSLADIRTINRDLARLLGVKHRGLELNRALDSAIYDAKLFINQHINEKEKKQALIAFSHAPLIVAGTHSFPSEIIEAFGLINVAEGDAPWPLWSMETLLRLKPRILIIAEGEKKLANYEQLFKNLGLNPHDLKITMLAPKEPLFNSPSPLLIDDTRRLLVLLDQALRKE